jgi:hypothetical protein
MIEGNAISDILLSIPLELRVYVLAGLVLVDLALGIVLAVRNGTFDWERLTDFVWSGMTKKMLSYTGMHLVFVNQQMNGMIDSAALTATFAALSISLVAGIKKKISYL